MKKILFFIMGAAVFFNACTNQTKESAKVELTAVEFSVSGMTCTMCEKAINTSVGKLADIDSVSSSFQKGSASVLFDQTKTNIEEIIKAIEKKGYKVESHQQLKE
jgi:copper ion binding protein